MLNLRTFMGFPGVLLGFLAMGNLTHIAQKVQKV